MRVELHGRGGVTKSTIPPEARAVTFQALDALSEHVAVLMVPDAGAEEELWDALCKLDAEQLTAVLEDAGAVLFFDTSWDGTMLAWLQCRRLFDRSETMSPRNPGINLSDGWRRFVPSYADIFDAVNGWMDKSEGVDTGGAERLGRKLAALVVDIFWRIAMGLGIYEIALGITPFVFTLELSPWPRYNMWAYLVLHSAAFYQIVWPYLPFNRSQPHDASTRNGNLAETGLNPEP